MSQSHMPALPQTSPRRDLSIRSELVQRIYNFYINQNFYVNRRYQRKLVWTIQEKRDFIDSILQGFPVPIILLAEIEKDKKFVFEIIDGMQRLNAVTSFIEGEFDFKGEYFDLQTMVESKSLFDNKTLLQKSPVLDRKICETISSYIMPLSIYSFENEEKIDEVFRRINYNGKHLSKQELRAAGSTSEFADLVRVISSEIRTDASASDVLLLNNMKNISITNKQLKYGIVIDEIFWVKNKILTKEMLRQSKDEEIIANIIAYMILSPSVPTTNSKILDEYYEFKEGENQERIQLAIKSKSAVNIKKQFIYIYDEIRKILHEANLNFAELICGQNTLNYISRPFQVIFFSFYDLIINKRMEIADYDGLIKSLKNINREINIRTSPTWNSNDKTRHIRKVKGLIQDCFKIREQEDPAIDCWRTEFETLLTQSKTEQVLYDFKQGFTNLNGAGEFNSDNFEKIIKTLTAMANHSPQATGYVCVGVADNEQTAQRIIQLYNIDSIEYKGYHITGIEHEALQLQKNLDNFYRWICQEINNHKGINQEVKTNLGNNIKLISYFNKSVVLFCIKPRKEPTSYFGKYYQRIGANIEEISVEEYTELFGRFLSK
ncbi:GmrSD restriction endonuclease domain-containing protein [Laspinema palackyanum]|uniref:GmrSD restriction endonuclease domain-containing protein n=1 Tax=Laspinema palackyanum TaxID=3231601 RepID=UPI00345D3A36|nr:DUF262 domain-containing protein [Laspinema sp. D2c]